MLRGQGGEVLGSVNVNVGAMTALQNLKSAQTDLSAAQFRASTGLKVASAKDDGATWAIAQQMRARIGSWKTADDSLARGQSLLDVAASGAGEIVDALGGLSERALALQDGSLDPKSRVAIIDEMKAISARIDQVANQTEFSGRRPLADTLTQTTVTYTSSGYVIPAAPMTPASLAGPMQPVSGGASQTFVRDGGTTAGRVDLFLDAYSVPDVLEIFQNGTRVAATGQAYVTGGGAVGAGVPVSGQNVLSFDYNPAAGRNLEFRFNENYNAVGSAWTVGGVVLQNPATPLPSPTVTSSSGTVTTSVATTYDFISDGDGGTQSVQARALTLQALSLDNIDWNDPGALSPAIESALAQATQAAAYFGTQQQAFGRILGQNHKTEDVLTAGVGNLVDADMAREATKLQATQTRQQLATTALSIANRAPEMLLKLFDG